MLTELIIKASLPRKAIKLLSHRNKLGDISRNFSGRSNKLEASDPKKTQYGSDKAQKISKYLLEVHFKSKVNHRKQQWFRHKWLNKKKKRNVKQSNESSNQESRAKKKEVKWENTNLNGEDELQVALEKCKEKKQRKYNNSGLIHYKVYSWIIKPLKKPKRRNSCGKKEKRSAAAILFFLANLEANKGWTINAEIWWCKLT